MDSPEGHGHEPAATADIVTRTMSGSDYAEALAVTARAFWCDPLVDFFCRDMLHEYRLLPAAFAVYFRDLSRPGAEAWVAERHGLLRGVTGWLAPGMFPRPVWREALRSARSAAVLVRGRHRRQGLRLLFEVDRHHPHEPHWYLALLATDPTVQGRGIGSALLTPVLERCDQQGIFAYTETQKEQNVSWYARAGFAVTREIRLPDTPTVWCLRRGPRR
jgi:ribosomal protein S18 acetylase RimI-like enzyme